MQTYIFAKTHDLSTLGAALWPQFPEWFYQDAQGNQRTDVALTGDGQTLTIHCPNSTDVVKLSNAIAAYDMAAAAQANATAIANAQAQQTARQQQLATDRQTLKTWIASGNTVLPATIAQAMARLMGAT